MAETIIARGLVGYDVNADRTIVLVYSLAAVGVPSDTENRPFTSFGEFQELTLLDLLPNSWDFVSSRVPLPELRRGLQAMTLNAAQEFCASTSLVPGGRLLKAVTCYARDYDDRIVTGATGFKGALDSDFDLTLLIRLESLASWDPPIGGEIELAQELAAQFGQRPQSAFDVAGAIDGGGQFTARRILREVAATDVASAKLSPSKNLQVAARDRGYTGAFMSVGPAVTDDLESFQSRRAALSTIDNLAPGSPESVAVVQFMLLQSHRVFSGNAHPLRQLYEAIVADAASYDSSRLSGLQGDPFLASYQTTLATTGVSFATGGLDASIPMHPDLIRRKRQESIRGMAGLLRWVLSENVAKANLLTELSGQMDRLKAPRTDLVGELNRLRSSVDEWAETHKILLTRIDAQMVAWMMDLNSDTPEARKMTRMINHARRAQGRTDLLPGADQENKSQLVSLPGTATEDIRKLLPANL